MKIINNISKYANKYNIKITKFNIVIIVIIVIILLVIFIITLYIGLTNNKDYTTELNNRAIQEKFNKFKISKNNLKILETIPFQYDNINLKKNSNIIIISLLLSFMVYDDNAPFIKDLLLSFENKADRFEFVQKDKMSVIFMSKGDTGYISFKGTSTGTDVFSDVVAIENKDFHNSHLGFHTASMSIIPEMLKFLYDNKQLKNVVLSGHSLGASSSEIMSIMISVYAYPHLNIYNITFGIPKTGTTNFKEKYRHNIKQCLSFENSGDPIVKLQLTDKWVHPCNITELSCNDKILIPECHLMGSYSIRVLNYLKKKDSNNQYIKLLEKIEWPK